MKKVITILAILALAVGMIFADAKSETHTIRIKSVVDNVRPVIQLKIANVSGSTNTGNNGDGNRFDGTNTYDDFDDDNAIQVFSINKGGTVTFQALLKNQTNTTEAYSLSFSGGVFEEVVRYGQTGGERTPSKITTAVGTEITSSNANKGIKSIALGTATDQYNKPVVVTFEGQLNTTTFPLTNGVVLATAEYEYPADPTIDTGEYFADVTLTVAMI
ncbi:MAG: hypothetical protein IKS77_01490 [Spirochaetales bacterium]|nr:hypothetical protein [Spirochaetales bacterium]